jgi:hypothetical protein
MLCVFNIIYLKKRLIKQPKKKRKKKKNNSFPTFEALRMNNIDPMKFMGPRLEEEYDFLSNKHKSNLSSLDLIEISDMILTKKQKTDIQEKDEPLLSPKIDVISENNMAIETSDLAKVKTPSKINSIQNDDNNYKILNSNSDSKQLSGVIKSAANDSIENPDSNSDKDLFKKEGENISPSKMLKNFLEKAIKNDHVSIEKKKSFKEILTKILGTIAKSNLFGFILTTFTIYALFADDVRVLAFTKENDKVFDIIALTAMGLFSLEIILNIICQQQYFNSFFFYLDIISTISITFDIMMFQEALLLK